MHESPFQVDLTRDDFPKEGLYLILPDQTRVEFIREDIECLADKYWSDPEKIPAAVKQTNFFQPCGHCPHYGEEVLCKALTPILPFIEKVDKCMSYDKVYAVYRDPDGVIYDQETTMQQALKYLSILSILFYCEMKDRYSRYFEKINPLENAHLISTKVYNNIYIEHHGNPEEIREVIDQMKKEVLASAVCLVKRLALICNNDAFINAFVNTHVIVDIMDFREMPGVIK